METGNRRTQTKSDTKARIRAATREVRVFDQELAQALIRQRQAKGLDKYDEVWEGVYVVPPLASNPHQDLVGFLTSILFSVITLEGRGRVQPGANVSDRREGWEHNYRDPDVVVVLKNGRAIDCETHWLGGPDFLIEIRSPRDDTDEKLPFYSQLGVRELLIIHRDTRALQLYRHDGAALVPVGPSAFRGRKWVVSEVVPLAFRRKGTRRNPHTEICRTDDETTAWTI